MSNLKAIKRERTSSGSNSKLRSEGLIPAILYGGKDSNQNILLLCLGALWVVAHLSINNH